MSLRTLLLLAALGLVAGLAFGWWIRKQLAPVAGSADGGKPQGVAARAAARTRGWLRDRAVDLVLGRRKDDGAKK